MQEKPNVRFSDIAGLEQVKLMIDDALVKPQRYPTLYRDIPPVRGILFYGPSGTGKTQLVRAMATEMDYTFMTVDSSQIFSKWVGDSEKAMRDVFSAARTRAPCILFIDEVDSILGEKSGNSGGSSESTDRVNKQFLTEMDGIRSPNAKMVVVAATNSPETLAANVLRRFQKTIEIPLPDAEARRVLVEIVLRKSRHMLGEEDVAAVAAATEGFSGSDMHKLAGEAMRQPIMRVRNATHFACVGEGRWAPCGSEALGAMEKRWDDLADEEIEPMPVTVNDFLECLALVKPSNTPESLAKYAAFTKKLGTKY